MGIRRPAIAPRAPAPLAVVHRRLANRRSVLLRLAGGSVTALFPLPVVLAAERPPEPGDAARWRTIGAVQDHLLPSEPGAPGAREIRATAYLQWVVRDERLDAREREFILRGADWLDGVARERELLSFPELAEAARERVLRAVTASAAGENWLSTLLVYLFEALLVDPVYGGNPDGVGWRWLGHTPGFPRPPADKIYGRIGYS